MRAQQSKCLASINSITDDGLVGRRKYKEAAELATESPQGILRTSDTSVPVQAGQTPPLLQYFGTLLTRGKLNAFESLELSRLFVNQNKKNLLENWLAEDNLECSEELGDLVKTVDNDLALKIYIKARVTPKVVTAFAEKREFDKILIHSKQTMERARSQETGIFKKKPADLMQIFKDVQSKVSDVVLGKEKPVEESNPEYEKLKHYIFELEDHLAEAQKHGNDMGHLLIVSHGTRCSTKLHPMWELEAKRTFSIVINVVVRYSRLIKDSHICIEKAMHHNCPVCFEYLFETTKDITVLPCGHTIHLQCVKEMEQHVQYSCPICSKSYCDMSQVWQRLDHEVASTPMPQLYKNKMVWILCNDFGETSVVNFHIVAHSRHEGRPAVKRSKGYAFIQYTSQDDALLALESMDHKKWEYCCYKVLSPESSQGVKEFLTEIRVISDIEHQNLVKLYGCCVDEDHRILFYNYLENNSLVQTLIG
ncbi:unnamed protein product [Camellia sinensis]